MSGSIGRLMSALVFDGSANYWEGAWTSGDTGWDIGEPAPPLTRLLAAVPVKQHAVVLGCGGGHEARMLAATGWPRVVGVDFAPSALAAARQKTDPSLVAALEWRLQDVLTLGARDGDHDRGLFDLVVEHTCFCAIDPGHRNDWAAMVARLLHPTGVLCALFYTHGRAGGPPFGATHDDVRAVLENAGLTIGHAEVPTDSISRRTGDEWLVIARRR
jgi:methyl halide transferase